MGSCLFFHRIKRLRRTPCGGRSNGALFAQVHFGKAENFARASEYRFYTIGNCAIFYCIKNFFDYYVLF